MSDTRIFTLGENAAGGNNLLAMLPALLQRQGVDPGLLALCQNRGQNGWGGDGIFGILLLFILMGAFNGGGFGGFGGNRGWGGNGQGGVVPILNNDANTAVIMQAVQRNGFDISSLATPLNSLYAIIPENRHKALDRFVRCFGLSPAKLHEALEKERS